MFETFFFHYFSFFRQRGINLLFVLFLFPSCLLILIWKWRLEETDREYWRYLLIFSPFLIAVFPEIPKLKQFVNKDRQF